MSSSQLLFNHVLKTALIDASKRGRIHEVKSLVENDGASLTCTDEQGLTPLHHACCHGRKEVVTYLVSKSKSVLSVDHMI